jgi:four helix bundle protein
MKKELSKMRRQGYEKLIVWQNAYKLRRLVFETTKKFPKLEFRRVSHMRETARSVKQNIQEGYLRPTIGDYIRFLGISQSSLAELIGDIQDCFDDKLIIKEEFHKLDSLAGKTDYLLTRLIQALYRKKKKGTWKQFTKTFLPDNP